MKTRILFILFVAALFVGCTKQQNQNTSEKFVVDDLGNKIVLNDIPAKVVSLAPNITEMIYKLGCGNLLVGNTTFCDYPEEAKKVTKVGDMLSVDFEKLISLKPDLVFVSVEGNKKEIYDKMISLGFKVFVSNPRNYDGIKKTYLDVAGILGKRDLALKETGLWDKELDKIRNGAAGFAGKKVLFLIEIKPIMAAGTSTFLNEYIRVLNLKNVSEGVQINYPVMNREEIIRLNPDIIVYPDDGMTSLESFKKSYPEWNNINAVKNNVIVFADRNLYFRPGPRFIEALESFCTNLHLLVK